jgi:DNA end-binding protein Ku
MGMLLRYPYEVRNAADYFDDIQDVKITKDMLDLAKHIVEQKSGHFAPENFEDHYEAALTELINKKRTGERINAPARPKGDNVVDLMDALRRSLAGGKGGAPKPAAAEKPAKESAKDVAKPGKARKRKTIAGQKEMLLPISGARAAATKDDAGKTRKPVKVAAKPAAKTRKAG